MCGVQSTAEQCMCGGCGKGCGEMELPLGFTRRMEELLGEESEAFFASYERERPQGLRLNGWKTREGRQAGWEQAGAAQEAAWLRERAAFPCGRSPGSRKDIFMGRTAGRAAAPSMRRASNICRSPAPWRPGRCWIRSRVTECWTCVQPQGESPAILPPGLRGEDSFSPMRFIRPGQTLR